MALTTKKKRSDLLLNIALKDGSGALIKDPIKPNVTTNTTKSITQAPVEKIEQAVQQSATPTVEPTKTTITTGTTGNTVQPTANAKSIPTEALEHMNGTYEPQLLTPVGSSNTQVVEEKVKIPSRSERLGVAADANNGKTIMQYEENSGIPQPVSEMNRVNELKETVKTNNTTTPVSETKPQEKSKTDDSNVVDYDNDANPYKSRVSELQDVINKLNADIEAKNKAYDELKNNSIDLLKGNNDEAWREQKERFNQAALNYKSELDAINKKSSMYYDDYLEMLGLKGSGAGAGLYNDMAVQNANAAMQIEANRQNQIEDARQANTDRLMALLDEAREKGITLNDEEMKDILGTYSKDSLAAGTDAEATRWNRFSNLAKQYNDEAEFNQLYQAAIVNGATSEELAQLAKLYGKDAKTREMEAAEIVGKSSKASETDETLKYDAYNYVDALKITANGKQAIKDAIDKVLADTTKSDTQKEYEITSILNNPNAVYSTTQDLDAGKNNVNNILKDSYLEIDNSQNALKVDQVSENDFGKLSGSGSQGDSQYVWVNTLIELAQEGAIPDGTVINMNVGYGSDDGENVYAYSNGYWYKVSPNKAKYNTATNNVKVITIGHGGKDKEIRDIKSVLSTLTNNNSNLNTIMSKYM